MIPRVARQATRSRTELSSRSANMSSMKRLLRLAWSRVSALWSHSLTVVTERPGFLMLNANGLMVVADKGSSTVTIEGRTVASFNAIQRIEIEYVVAARSAPWWRVRLQVIPAGSVPVGETDDSTDASIAAAHLSSVTGKPVSSVSKIGALFR
jgi:hypothetical protein